MPVPVELWMPDQDWLESTEMTVGQSEWPDAADVSELHTKEEVLARMTFKFRHCVTARLISDQMCIAFPRFLLLFELQVKIQGRIDMPCTWTANISHQQGSLLLDWCSAKCFVVSFFWHSIWCVRFKEPKPRGKCQTNSIFKRPLLFFSLIYSFTSLAEEGNVICNILLLGVAFHSRGCKITKTDRSKFFSWFAFTCVFFSWSNNQHSTYTIQTQIPIVSRDSLAKIMEVALMGQIIIGLLW